MGKDGWRACDTLEARKGVARIVETGMKYALSVSVLALMPAPYEPMGINIRVSIELARNSFLVAQMEGALPFVRYVEVEPVGQAKAEFLSPPGCEAVHSVRGPSTEKQSVPVDPARRLPMLVDESTD